MRYLTPLAAVALLLAGCASSNPLNGSDSPSNGSDTQSNANAPDIPETPVIESYEAPDVDRDRMLGQREQIRTNLDSVGNGIADLPELTKYANAVLDKLQSQSPRPDIDTEVRILDSPDYNAYARRDGTIVVTMGAFHTLKNENQLAGLLAHELAHVLYAHTRSDQFLKIQKQIVSFATMGTDLLQDMNGDEGEDARQRVSKVRLIAEISQFLTQETLAPVYERAEEKTADLVAVDLMHAAGYVGAKANQFVKPFAREKANRRAERTNIEKRLAQHLIQKLDLEAGSAKSMATELAGKTIAVIREGWEDLFVDEYMKPEERADMLVQYWGRHYRGESGASLSPPKFPWSPEADRGWRNRLDIDLDTDRIAAVLANYENAYAARNALEEGKLDKAVRLSRQAVSGPTRSAGYPRMTFYNVRKEQGRSEKMLANLRLGMEASDPAPIFYETAVKLLARNGNEQKALKLANAGAKKLDHPPSLWPWRINLLYRTGETMKATKLQAECRAKYAGARAWRCRNWEKKATADST